MIKPGETGIGEKLRTLTQTTKSEETRRQRLREAGGGADRLGKPRTAGRKGSPRSSENANCRRLRPAVGCGQESAPPSPLAVQSGSFLLYQAPSSGPAVAWNLPLPLLAPDTTRSNSGPSCLQLPHGSLAATLNLPPRPPPSSVRFPHALPYWLPVC